MSNSNKSLAEMKLELKRMRFPDSMKMLKKLVGRDYLNCTQAQYDENEASFKLACKNHREGYYALESLIKKAI